MAASKQDLAWGLKYRDLASAARAIDELRSHLDHHDKIDSHAYLEHRASLQSIDHYVHCVIPQIDFARLESLPEKENMQVWSALNRAMPQDCELDDCDEQQVAFLMRICNLDECDSCVEEYVESILAALDLADNEEVYVQQILNDPQVKFLLEKHKLLRRR